MSPEHEVGGRVNVLAYEEDVFGQVTARFPAACCGGFVYAVLFDAAQGTARAQEVALKRNAEEGYLLPRWPAHSVRSCWGWLIPALVYAPRLADLLNIATGWARRESQSGHLLVQQASEQSE